MLFLRALSAFLVLPGTIGFVVPWLLRPDAGQFGSAGLPLLAAGTALLLWCVRDFYVAGRGTLAPWSPPARLVVVGLYQLSRNPMYVAVVLILCGWALAYASGTLWIYAGIVAVAFHVRTVWFEEPWLAARYGDEYAAYTARVRRWLGVRGRM
jgi:protein-S-isoprenylcysteine O-methyltransferase Ste14